MHRVRTLATAVLFALAFLTSPAHADPPPGPITASAATDVTGAYPTNYSVGMMRVNDSDYALGKYDALLPGTHTTRGYLGWTSTAGFWVGPGACHSVWRAYGTNAYVFYANVPGGSAGRPYWFPGTPVTWEIENHCVAAKGIARPMGKNR